MNEGNEKPEDDLDLDVQVEEDAPEAEEAPVVAPEDGIADLKRQLEEERARRAEAERKAQQAAQEAHRARIDKDDSDIQLVANAIDTLERDTEMLRHAYAQAMQQGDFQRAAQISEEVSDNKAKLLQLSNGLEAMKAKPKEAPPPAHADPVEAFAAQLSPRSADWVRAHPEFVRDPAKTRKMIAAHELAVADGIAPDTDAYFAAIEETLRVRTKAVQPTVDEDASASAAKVTQRRDAAPAAAPVSRGSSQRPNVVRLTAAEREMAEMMNMKPEDYAKHKMALIKEGKLQ